MSSIAAGLIGVGDHALYSGSKSAVNGITKSFAKDFGDKGMTVNAIAPGGVKSDMFAQVAWKYIPGATGEWSAERIEGAMASHCPLGRCAVPQDVARVVAFLAGEDGGWVNGEFFFFFFFGFFGFLVFGGFFFVVVCFFPFLLFPPFFVAFIDEGWGIMRGFPAANFGVGQIITISGGSGQ